MAIEQTSAISALTQVTTRDPQETAALVREKKSPLTRRSKRVLSHRVNYKKITATPSF